MMLTNNDLDDDDVLVHQLSIISAAGKWRVESTTSLWSTRSNRTRWSSPLSSWTLSSSPPLSNPRDQAGQGEEDISHRASVCIDVVSVIIATNHPDTSLEKNTWIAMSEILQVAGWSWKQKWWPLVKQTHKVMTVLVLLVIMMMNVYAVNDDSFIQHNHKHVENHNVIRFLYIWSKK